MAAAVPLKLAASMGYARPAMALASVSHPRQLPPAQCNSASLRFSTPLITLLKNDPYQP